MDLKSLCQDLAALRTVSERFNRLNPTNALAWNVKDCLAAGTNENIMLIENREAFRLDRPVNLERFYTAIRGVKTGQIVTDPGGLRVLSGGSRDEVPYSQETPIPLPSGAPFQDRSTNLKVPADALEFVAQAMSRDTVRYALQSVFFDSKNGAIVASDGKRLHWRPIETEKQFPPVLLSTVGVKGLLAMMKREGLPLKRLRLSNDKKDSPSQASFLVDRSILYSRLVEGSFPDWKTVLPGPFSLELRLDADRFRSVMKDILAFSRGSERAICYFRLGGESGSIDLICSRTEKKRPGDKTPQERSTRRHTLKILVRNGDLRAINFMAFNPTYLAESSWNDRETVLQVSNQQKALLVDGCAIIMPLTGIIEISDQQSAAYKLTEKAYCNIRRAKSDPISTWRQRAVARAKDPLDEELAPKPEVPVATIPKRFEEIVGQKPEPAAPPPPMPAKKMHVVNIPIRVEKDKKKPDAKAASDKNAQPKQHDFLFFS